MNRNDFIPEHVNRGPWITSYTLNDLRNRPQDSGFILPICSWTDPLEDLLGDGRLILPPLYHEALNPSLEMRLVEQILTCFPEFDAMQQNRKRLTIVKRPFTDRPRPLQGSIIAFSVDTAVEEHARIPVHQGLLHLKWKMKPRVARAKRKKMTWTKMAE